MPRGAASDDRPEPVTWLEVDLGDTEIRLQEHPDGQFTLDAATGEDGRLLLTGAELAAVAAGFVHLATEKGWLSLPHDDARRPDAPPVPVADADRGGVRDDGDAAVLAGAHSAAAGTGRGPTSERQRRRRSRAGRHRAV